MPRLMTEKETAVMVGMSVHWLRRKRWEGGGIPFVKMSTKGAVRYSEETVQQYIETHFRISTSDTGGRRLLQPGAGEPERH
ncbi:hypothetical protein GMLC_20580 [Geomonas limicola]|uniref:Helix-turn-helix domain-containing protein n=1 Tax=Geomonas limicola TaxID=2740186 RepID=A0A6V8NB85_9BACT|nr:DNA-binding protein [Geomonas limicola]GFO68479.1 hypothetical protein GMLC_20580 [Geomonas limicola]